MSRYFFHVMDGKAVVDADGTELASVAEARAEAIGTAGQILADMDARLWHGGREWTMTVADHVGRVVFALRYSADDHKISG
jgi:hypothetical protein